MGWCCRAPTTLGGSPWETAAIELAPAAGVERSVRLSTIGAAPGAPVPSGIGTAGSTSTCGHCRTTTPEVRVLRNFGKIGAMRVPSDSEEGFPRWAS